MNDARWKILIGSERFLHLLALIETTGERPVVEFRTVTRIDGLEYISAAETKPSLRFEIK